MQVAMLTGIFAPFVNLFMPQVVDGNPTSNFSDARPPQERATSVVQADSAMVQTLELAFPDDMPPSVVFFASITHWAAQKAQPLARRAKRR